MEIGVALEMVAEGVEALGSVDASLLLAEDLMGSVRDLEVVRRQLDAATIALADRVDRTNAYRVDGHSSATSAVKHLGRLSGAEASGRVKGAAALRRLPLFTKSYLEGRIPTGHLRCWVGWGRILGLRGSSKRPMSGSVSGPSSWITTGSRWWCSSGRCWPMPMGPRRSLIVSTGPATRR